MFTLVAIVVVVLLVVLGVYVLASPKAAEKDVAEVETTVAKDAAAVETDVKKVV